MGFFSSQARKLSSKPKAASRRDREIEAHGAMLPVRVVEHTRARRLTLRIMPGGRTLKLTVPPYVGEEQIDIFLERNDQLHTLYLIVAVAILPSALFYLLNLA